MATNVIEQIASNPEAEKRWAKLGTLMKARAGLQSADEEPSSEFDWLYQKLFNELLETLGTYEGSPEFVDLLEALDEIYSTAYGPMRADHLALL